MLIRLLPDKLAHILFRSFEASEAFENQVAELRQKYPNRPIAFALLGGGFIEFWAMRTFLREKFGSSFDLTMATRVPGIFVEPFGTLVRRVASKIYLSSKPRSRVRLCADELLKDHPVVLNFEYTDRQKAFEIPESEKELSYLAQRVPNLLIVPVVFLWRRKRNILQGPSQDFSDKIIRGLLTPLKLPRDLLLGDPAYPTAVRKIAILLRQYGRSALRTTEPVSIDSANVKILRRKIITSILQEKKVTLGPVMFSPKFIGERVLRSASFNRLIRNLAAEEGVSEISLLRKSQKYFKEMAADFSYFTIEVFAWFLSWVFVRVFNGLTFSEEEFEKLRLSSKEGTLIFVPSHKSYFDFLIMSYVLFREEVAPPHIAAGINLSFWPVGPIFRSAGAFFIRRSFRGNVIYSEVLRRYIAALLQGRTNIEFFIEGARSRNGKLAPPKFGMLKMIVDSHYEGLITEKIRIIPVSFNYERVTEARSHRREMEGGEKVQESVGNLIKSTSVLFKKYGVVDVRLSEAINFEERLEQYVGAGSADPNIRKLGIQKLAFEICHRINGATPVTGAGLICCLLLAKPGAALPEEEFDAWRDRLFADLKTMNVLLNPSLAQNFTLAWSRALKGLMEDKIIEKYETPEGKSGVRIPQRQRVAALYYKNSAIHALLNPAIVGFAGDSLEDALELRSLLQFEFFFSEKESYLQSLAKVPANVMRGLYALMLDDVLENVSLGLNALIGMQKQSLDEKEWRNRLMKFGRTAIMESTIGRFEAVNTQGFNAFIQMARNKKWLVAGLKEGQSQPAPATELSKALDRIKEFRDRLKDWNSIRARYLEKPPHESASLPESV